MRKSRQETAETRQRIVEAASKEFRSHGMGGSGLDELMAAAKLTRGGFYRHFASKEQLIEESLALAAESWLELLDRGSSGAAKGKHGLNTLIAEYVSIAHRDDAANGCPFVALGSELARSSKAIREDMTTELLKMLDFIAGQLDGMSPAAARKEALWMLSTMIGAVTLARFVTDPAISASILHEARKRLMMVT